MSLASSMRVVQQGIYTALTGDAALTALLTGGSGVLDAVPANPVFPYVVIGESIEVPDRTMGQGGHEVLTEVTVYTQDGATKAKTGKRGFKSGLTILERIHELLVGDVAGVRTLTVTGFDLIDVDVDFSQTVRETDGITRTTDCRYRMRLETQP